MKNSFGKIAILVIMLAVGYWIISGIIAKRSVESEKQAVQAEKQLQTKKSVEDMATKHNAVADWRKKLDLKTSPIDEILYTIQIQDVFLKEKMQPYLFFVSIQDIKRVNNKYLLIAYESYPVDFRGRIWIIFRLTCSDEIVGRILKQKPSYFDRYALVAYISSIEKPDLYIRPTIEYDLLAEDNTFAETHPDDIYNYLDLEISGDNQNTFVATGKCDDLMFIAEEDWMDNPTDFEEFIRIYESNQP